MIKKYDARLVWNYINGMDIENVDELENDYKFMMEVIRISKDKKIYRLCTDDVKNNYEFVKFIVLTFKDDLKFIDGVVKDYLEVVGSDHITFKELCFIMCNILQHSSEKSEYIEYFTTRAIVCSRCRFVIDTLLSKNKGYINKYGMGFMLVLCDDIGESDVIVRYIASEFLYEIFNKNDISLEDLIHKEISNRKKINEIGIVNFILLYVERYDRYLADYLKVNIDLIKKLEKKIAAIEKNWDLYVGRVNRRKDCIFFQEACNFIEEYGANFTYGEICYYIDNKLNLPLKLSVSEESDYVELIDVTKLSLNDYKCLKKIINLAKEMYLSPIINWEFEQNDLYTDGIVPSKNGRILRLFPENNDGSDN